MPLTEVDGQADGGRERDPSTDGGHAGRTAHAGQAGDAGTDTGSCAGSGSSGTTGHCADELLDAGPPAGSACEAATTRDACMAKSACAVFTGRELDRTAGCWMRPAMAACAPAVSRMCGMVVTGAVAPDGSCWRFSSDCVPPGWRAGDECDATAAAVCE